MNWKQLERDAEIYFNSCKICQTQEELYDFYANAISDEIGLDYDEAYKVVEIHFAD